MVATRLLYAVPIARELALSARDRLRGGLRARLPSGERRFVIVTGAGRSGTSAVARVLHESGVRMGAEFHPPSDFNPVGFYEETGVRLINEQMITELGMANFWRPGRWPWRSTVLAVARNYRDQIADAVSKATDGWKDPLFAVTLEAWLPHLPSAPKVVVCLRSPDSFADSTARRYGLVDRGAARRRWAQQYRRLLDVIRDYGLEITSVEYDELVEQPEPVVARLAQFVGHPLSAEYVEPPLRRFQRPVPAEYIDLYDEVLSLGGATAPASRRTTGPPDGAVAAAASPEEIDGYVELIHRVEADVAQAKAIWTERVGMPRPAVGERSSGAMAQTRAASDEYASVLEEAQGELSGARTPAGFEGVQDLAQQAVNYERLIVELMRAALQHETPDRRMLRATVRAWRRFGSERAVEKARRHRERALERALGAARRAPISPG